ncbi:MAG TPA: hypothetical protein VEN81_07770 [Planctomycetota bacterium]|nr:hypothetical protein [Planctomycetota bacterium]
MPRDRWRAAAEAMVPLALVAWRIASLPIKDLWRDVLLLLGLYWILEIGMAARGGSRIVRTLFMAFMMGIYLQGQLPFALKMLRP